MPKTLFYMTFSSAFNELNWKEGVGMSEYPPGNKTILQMIDSGTFDAALAEALLNGADLNAPICDLSGYSTTYLYEAVSNNNLQAVAFLLEHGADPNLNIPELIGDCALWQLQFLDNGQDWQTRHEISKLFFQYPSFLQDSLVRLDRRSDLLTRRILPASRFLQQ